MEKWIERYIDEKANELKARMAEMIDKKSKVSKGETEFSHAIMKENGVIFLNSDDIDKASKILTISGKGAFSYVKVDGQWYMAEEPNCITLANIMEV